MKYNKALYGDNKMLSVKDKISKSWKNLRPYLFYTFATGSILFLVIKKIEQEKTTDNLFKNYATEQNISDLNTLYDLRKHQLSRPYIDRILRRDEFEKSINEFELKYKIALDSIKRVHGER